MAPQTITHALPGLRVDRRKRARGVEPMVPEELERVPMEDVRSRLGHRVDGCARVHAGLCRQRARRNAELLQCIREWQWQAAGVLHVVVHGAVEQIGDAEGQAAGHGDIYAALETSTVGAAGFDGRARQHDQVSDLAPLQR
jgi:hypothetical protein